MKNQNPSRSALALLAFALVALLAHAALADVTLDTNFNAQATGPMQSLALQRDGKILVWGSVQKPDGQTRIGLCRLNSDGSLDWSFNPEVDGAVLCMAVQADGKIVVGGEFLTLGGKPCSYLGRLNVDGTVDNTFNPRASYRVDCLAVQKDGKILVGGEFRMLGDVTCQYLGRLQASGEPDGSFRPRPDGYVYSLAVQQDGRILVGGKFATLGGELRNALGRLNPDGSLDADFNAEVERISSTLDPIVTCLALQGNGQILVAGTFDVVGAQERRNIARLNTNGTLDDNFNPGVNNTVYSMAEQADGKILVVGMFGSLGGQPRSYLGRLNSDGSLDASFNPGASFYVRSLALQADGKILAAGGFSTLGGRACNYLGRLNNTEPSAESLTLDNSAIAWLRGVTAPELSFSTFEVTADGGAHWGSLGYGTRVPGGWQLKDLNVAVTQTVRASGKITGGYNNGSSWFLQHFTGPLAVWSQPLSRTNFAGSTALFTVHAWEGGEERAYYQWRKNGTNLIDGGNVWGVQSPMLVLTNVLGADQGDYTVVVSNLSCSVTSVVAQLSVVDPLIVSQPAGQIRNPGESATLEVVATGTLPLNYQWMKDGIVLAEKTTSRLVLTNLSARDAGLYRVVVSNQWSATSAAALLTVNGATVDEAFDPGADRVVYALALQPDEKVLVGGGFKSLGGQARNYMGRLHAEGYLDSSFETGVGGGSVGCITMQEDGDIVVGGSFTSLGDQPRAHLGRFNSDGTVDNDFYPGVTWWVSGFALQEDGKIVVGGDFSALGGQPRANLGRLNSDGRIDVTFKPGANGTVYCLALQPDGKILVGGNFTELAGRSRNHIGRLNGDGSLDTSFNPGAADAVYALALQPDGKILVGGRFTELAGQSRAKIARLNADGSLDTSFNPGANGDLISSLVLQADGKLIVGGLFTMLGGQSRTNIGRLNPDGTLDPTFDPGANGEVYSLGLQANGSLVVGGSFETLGGQSRTNLGRLNNTEPATQSLLLDGSSVTWLRGGSSPEVWRTTFDVSTNGGISWMRLGKGTRIAGGWQLGGLSLPANTTVRARGHTTGGYRNGSSWFVESFAGLLAIADQPQSRTNTAGSTARFSVRTVGGVAGTQWYQWRKDGTNLVDGANAAGARTDMLVLSNVIKPNEGEYTVVVGDLSGSVTSVVAQLSVTDPFISTQPMALVRYIGQSATFSVTAGGTPPISYRWYRNDIELIGQKSSSVALPNVTAADAGYYHVVVSNPWGSVTSTAAPLTVNAVTADTNFNPGANAIVNTLAVQVDGGIVVGGGFTTLGGRARKHIGRLNPDGSVDTAFNPGVNTNVLALALETEGRILLGGGFYELGGNYCYGVGRLNPDGSIVYRSPGTTTITVFCLALQADGRIVTGGNFTSLGNRPRNFIGRLLPDGGMDESFRPEANDSVYALAVQPDGMIIVGGSFTTLGGQPRYCIGRLDPDGRLDTILSPTIEGSQPSVKALAVQSDGRIVVGGKFEMVSGQWYTNIVRLNSDGSVDRTFNPGASGIVRSLALQADGKILVGGYFTILGGQSRTNIGRLNADGRVDAAFNPGASSGVFSLSLQEDGKILAGGEFSILCGQSRKKIGRLNNTEAATQSLTFDGSAITWLRGGTSPEVSRTTFEITTNGGVSWLALGSGMRIAGGWKVEGLSLPTSSTVHARGFQDGSGWLCTAVVGPWAVLSQPSSRTNNAGTTASFTVEATTDRGMTNYYQWRRNGTNLVDEGNVSGARAAKLVLSYVLGPDRGDYTVVLSNSSGSITSVVARLTVVDPRILTQPKGVVLNPGDSTTLVAAGHGTLPLHYQWMKDGIVLAGETTNFLMLTNLSASDAGYYNVVVSNNWGSATSVAVPLTVNGATSDSGFSPGPNGSVSSLALQADGRILVGGYFTNLVGQPRNYIGRLNPDGSLDTTFDPGANISVSALALQSDGRILVGGYFTNLVGQPRNYIGRLNADGSLDTTFDPGANDNVSCLALQADGKILVGGYFTTLGGQPRSYIGRLNPDGSLDTSFNPGTSKMVLSFALDQDGKIIAGGVFTTLGGLSRNSIGRLNSDGSPDASFNPGTSGTVYCLAVQVDGKILVGGSFKTLGGQPRDFIGRLNPDGSVDATFNPGANQGVYSLALQADGKILVGGWFTTLGGRACNYIGRLNADGSVDATFNPGADSFVKCLAVQADGKIIVGGVFTVLAGQSCTNLGRLNSTGGPLLPRIASSAPSLAAHEDGFGFNFTGVAGSYMVIEGSADLENWTPVRTNFLNTSVGTFRDPAVTNTPTRYYRLHVQ